MDGDEDDVVPAEEPAEFVVDKDFRTASDSRCALTIVPIVRFHRLVSCLGF